MESWAQPRSTVRRPMTETSGPMVDPQGMSLRTSNSWTGTPASLAMRRTIVRVTVVEA